MVIFEESAKVIGELILLKIKESKYLQKHNIMVRRLTENGI